MNTCLFTCDREWKHMSEPGDTERDTFTALTFAPLSSHLKEWYYKMEHLLALSETVVLSLWVMTPLGTRNRYPAYQTFTLWFITVAKVWLWKSKKIILWLGVITTWDTVIKGHSIRKGENRSSNRLRRSRMKELITTRCVDITSSIRFLAAEER